MNEKHIKPVGEPEAQAEAPPQQSYPRTNLQFGPLGGGFAMQIMLADDIIITKLFKSQDEDQICDILIKRRTEVKELQRKELQLIRHVNTHRND